MCLAWPDRAMAGLYSATSLVHEGHQALSFHARPRSPLSVCNRLGSVRSQTNPLRLLLHPLTPHLPYTAHALLAGGQEVADCVRGGGEEERLFCDQRRFRRLPGEGAAHLRFKRRSRSSKRRSRSLKHTHRRTQTHAHLLFKLLQANQAKEPLYLRG